MTWQSVSSFSIGAEWSGKSIRNISRPSSWLGIYKRLLTADAVPHRVSWTEEANDDDTPGETTKARSYRASRQDG
jgi:hypothetical protein